MERNIKSVGDLNKPFPQGSCELRKILREMTVDCDASTPVFVFKEVRLDRMVGRSRRADLVFYVPFTFVLYVEYKTKESKRVTPFTTAAHESQLRDTHNNLVSHLTYQMSLHPGREMRDAILPIYTLLLTRRFWDNKSCGDVAVPYCPLVRRGVKEPTDPNVLKHILCSMSHRVNLGKKYKNG